MNSMMEKLDYNYYITEYKMSGKNTPTIFLEGDDDFKAFRKFFKNNIKLKPVGGKVKVIKIVDNLKKDSNNIIGVIDKDYDIILQKDNSSENIFYTDENDLLISIFKTESINSIFGSTDIDNIRNTKINKCKTVGILRLINSKNEWMIKFEDCHKKLLELDRSELLSFFTKHKLKNSITEEELNQQILELEKLPAIEVINGHDLCHIIGKKINKNKNDVAKTLCYLYQLHDFKNSYLYQSIRHFFEEKLSYKDSDYLIN